MDTKMSIDERQKFLAETRVGIISIPEEGRGPLSVPVWYNYTPGGEICIWTGIKTRRYKLLHSTQRISFVVQDPTPPWYKYVSVEGTFSIRPVDPEKDIHTMAIRYYGADGGERYFADVKKDEGWKDSVMVCIKPERWFTADFSKLKPSSQEG